MKSTEDDYEIMSTTLQTPTAKELHDLLLSVKPSEASHDANVCPFCSKGPDGGTGDDDHTPEGGDMSKYTEEDLQAAIAEAVKPLREELDALKTSEERAAVEAQIAELTAAHEAAKLELQASLDAAMAEAAAAKQHYDELIAYLQSEVEREATEAALEERKAEIASQVKEKTALSEEYIAERVESWASMDQETFEAMLDGWAAVSEASKNSANLGATAMQASASDEGGQDVAAIRRQLQKTDRSAIRTIGPRL